MIFFWITNRIMHVTGWMALRKYVCEWAKIYIYRPVVVWWRIVWVVDAEVFIEVVVGSWLLSPTSLHLHSAWNRKYTHMCGQKNFYATHSLMDHPQVEPFNSLGQLHANLSTNQIFFLSENKIYSIINIGF